jgi:hypothetical protein
MTIDSGITSRQFDSALEERIYSSLLSSGWQDTDILAGRAVLSLAGSQFIPDIVLLANLYPLAAIEVMRPSLDIEGQRQTAERLAEFAKSIKLPIALLTDGEQIFSVNPTDATITRRETLPTKPELLQFSGTDQWSENDPRLYPAYLDPGRIPALHQALAVSRTLDSLLAGKKRTMVSMPTGTGVTYVSFQLSWKLLQSRFVGKMLFVAASLSDLEYAYKYFTNFTGDVVVWGGQKRLKPNNARVNLATMTAISTAAAITRNGLELEEFDLVIVRDVHRIKPALLEQFKKSIVVAFTSSSRLTNELQQLFGEPVYSYTVREALAADEIQPPEGFHAVKLSEIAEITSGAVIKPRSESSSATDSVYVLRGHDLRSDGTISFIQANRISDKEFVHAIQARNEDRVLLQPSDIVISSVGARVAIVPTSLPGSTIFSSSLLRIRVDLARANPEEVFQFLRSDVGQGAIRLIASSITGIPRITKSILSELQIFLKALDGTRTATPKAEPQPELSAVAKAIREIKDEILPALEQSETLSTDEGDNHSLELVAGRLAQLATILVPLSLMERVIAGYPMPIALAYRRFYEARFNVYEQVPRLKDLFEAAAFFAYNVVLADSFRRLDGKDYFIEDSGARRAYNGYSMSARMDFIEEILNTARGNSQQELFLPELTQTSVVRGAKELQEKLRNTMSHTATATETQQKNIIREYQPQVEQMLDELDFLRKYQLVRVTSFYFSHSQFFRRMEVYHGTYTKIDEQAVSEDTSPTKADRDHIILLDADGDVLDLYPLYQMIATGETRFENHMCFFKQRKQKDRRLEGESVQGSFAVDLEGFDEFENLQTRILNSKA